jgi:tRNA threonylcarbamoyladenosine biosynthesis protein TsaB
MHILALETSGAAGSIAAAEGPRLVADLALDVQQRSAKSLAPGIRQVVDAAGWRIREVDLVAVTIGPGSFTGLRVGVATAKALAYALGARCVAVGTLEVIGAQAPGTHQRLAVAMDAGRSQFFAAAFERSAGEAPSTRWTVADPSLVDQDRWLADLAAGGAVTGPALTKIRNRLPPGVSVVDAREWNPRADTLAAIAWRRHLAGAYDDVWKLAPLYLRKSAAEEKLDKQ